MKPKAKSNASAYQIGYRSAYAATSWTLSGETFDLNDEATEHAAAAVRGGEIGEQQAADYIKGFAEYCREHFGTWTATERAAGLVFRCISAGEAWDSYQWGVPGAKHYHVYEDGDELVLADYFPESVEVGNSWACEVYRHGFAGQGYGPTLCDAVAAALADAKDA